jgi:Ca-activated chloride channel family protein
MITDGKPSAMTLPSGKIYKSAFGLDPMILEETYKEVAILPQIWNSHQYVMLAKRTGHCGIVKKVTEICRGKAYFTTRRIWAVHSDGLFEEEDADDH